MLYLDDGLPTLVNDLERPVFHVSFDLWFVVFPTDQTLGVEDRVGGVGVVRIFSAITDSAAKNNN